MKIFSLISRAMCAAAACLLVIAASAMAQETHGHSQVGHRKTPELGTSAAIDRQGRLWVVMKETTQGEQYVALQSSPDLGKTWSPPVRVLKTPEPVAANGEARPRIAFGGKDELYITYSRTIAKPHKGDVRFVRSLDGGKTFSEPVTVHANRDLITHSFEAMAVDEAGRIYIAWIDGRDKEAAKAKKDAYAGVAVYYAVSSDRGATFQGDYKLADHSCECCRIGLTLDAQGRPVAMWRHVFAPNIRDHALAELTPDGKPSPLTRATFDDWRIDACPHHGPSLAYAADGTRHQVWFNGKEGDGGGALYARVSADGKPGTPVALGSAQASHPDVAVQGKQVVVAWKQFDGKSTAILARISGDGGISWDERELARTSASSDQPRLLPHASGVLLVWRTQDDGIVVVPIGEEKK